MPTTVGWRIARAACAGVGSTSTGSSAAGPIGKTAPPSAAAAAGRQTFKRAGGVASVGSSIGAGGVGPRSPPAAAARGSPQRSAVVASVASWRAGGVTHVSKAARTHAPLLARVLRSAPGYGPRLAALIELAPAGSGRRGELEAAAKEAVRTEEWLYREHGDWYANFFPRIEGAALRKDMIQEYFAKLGAAYTAVARRSVGRYEEFVRKKGAAVAGSGGAYPATEDVVAWFALDALDGTRAHKARLGHAFKGTSGRGVVKGLQKAATAFKAPFDASLFSSELVKMAARKPPDAEAVPADEAHIGVFVQCWMEEVAASTTLDLGDGFVHVLSEEERDFAAAFAVCGLGGVRDVEALRSCVEEVGEKRYQFRCAGGKVSHQWEMKPFSFVVPKYGFTPAYERAMHEWMASRG